MAEEGLRRYDGSPLRFLGLIGDLKSLRRTGWIREGISQPETVAAHMYRVAILTMFAPVGIFGSKSHATSDIHQDGLDKARCILLALCHDMAEAVAGDIPTYENVAPGKHISALTVLRKLTACRNEAPARIGWSSVY